MCWAGSFAVYDGCDIPGDVRNVTCNNALYDSKDATCVGRMVRNRTVCICEKNCIKTKSTMTVSNGQNTGNNMNFAYKEQDATREFDVTGAWTEGEKVRSCWKSFV